MSTVHLIIKGTFQKPAECFPCSPSSVTSQVRLQGETHWLLPPHGKLLRRAGGARSMLFFTLRLVDAAFTSIASALLPGLALTFDPDNQLYLFCHCWGSPSTLNSSPLWFDLCLEPTNLGILPPGQSLAARGDHKLELTYRIAQGLPALPPDPVSSCSRVWYLPLVPRECIHLTLHFLSSIYRVSSAVRG